MSFNFGSTAPSSGFSFGSAAPAAPAAPAAGGFSFGTTATPAPAAATTSAFSFGSTANSAPTAPASTGFSFGSTASTAPASTGFSFGSTASTAPASTGFSFGSTASTAPATSGFSFGSTASTAPATSGFSFGSSASTAPAAGGFSFGQPAATGFGAPAAAAPAAPFNAYLPSGAIPTSSPHSMAQSDPVIARINVLASKIDLTSENCCLQAVVYNKVDPSFLPLLSRPPHANETIWQAGVENNPDPSNLAPCLLVGFDDLERRVAEQVSAVTIQEQVLTSMAKRVSQLASRQDEVKRTIAAAIATQNTLARRLLLARNKLEVAALRGNPLLSSEQDYARRIEQINKDLSRTGGLEARVVNLCNKFETYDKDNIANTDSNDAEPNEVFDEKTLQYVHSFLANNSQCLQKLSDEIHLSRKDAIIISDGYEHTLRSRK